MGINNVIKNIVLSGGVLASTLGTGSFLYNGYQEMREQERIEMLERSRIPIEGKVISEGFLRFTNIKHSPLYDYFTYDLTLQMDNGEDFYLEIIGSPEEKRHLNKLINFGTRIRFQRGNIYEGERENGEKYLFRDIEELSYGEFPNHLSKKARRITILDQPVKTDSSD